MTMREPLFGDYAIPLETKTLAEKIFPKGNIYMKMYEHFGTILDNQEFLDLFSTEGSPSISPVRLIILSIWQYMENLSDQQVAEFVRDRISWKYALGLPLDDTGFHSSVLSEFRGRLIAGSAELRAFDATLEVFKQEGLLTGRGKQRTDSTHVLAAVRDLNRVEMVGEAIRHVLNVLAEAVPAWVRSHVQPDWVDRYERRIDTYHIAKSHAERDRLAMVFGTDGWVLIEAIRSPDSPPWLQDLPAVQTLIQVWEQNYTGTGSSKNRRIRWRSQTELAPSSERIVSPYDPDARCASKRETTWVGYKVHVTETCEETGPSIITHVATTPATTNDEALIPTIHATLAEQDLMPAEHYVDSGYIDADNLVMSQHDAIDLVGPALANTSWQARTGGYALDLFVIDWEAHHATCPQGHRSRVWKERDGPRGTGSMIRVQFDRNTCAACQARGSCTQSATNPRTLNLLRQPQYDALHAARERQATEEFRTKYHRRAGVEGTISQGDRRGGLHQSRYIGEAKTRLQHIFVALALNFVRVLTWLMGNEDRAQTRVSAFSRVMAALP